MAAGVASIMTAHILIPALDEERPATLSPRIVDGMLKRELGYRGLVLTDDLEMKAISGKYGVGGRGCRAIAAGCDAVLMCGAIQERRSGALEALIHAVEDGTLPVKRVEDALTRQRRVKERFLAPPHPRPLTGTALRDAARPRRAPGRRGRDGEVRLAHAEAARAQARRSHRRGRARQRVRSREFDAGIEEIRALGFEPVYEESVFERRAYPAGPADVRAAAWLRAWRDPSIAALIAVRGGYGSVHLLPLLAVAGFDRAAESVHRLQRQHVDPVLADHAHGGIVSFHGPMLEGRLAQGEAGYDRDTFLRCLCRPEPMGEIAHPQVETLHPGERPGCSSAAR